MFDQHRTKKKKDPDGSNNQSYRHVHSHHRHDWMRPHVVQLPWKVTTAAVATATTASCHTTSAQHPYRTVQPMLDLICNEILLWILPTHPVTHAIKFVVVTWLWMWLAMLWCATTGGSQQPQDEQDLVPLPSPWFDTFASILWFELLLAWCLYQGTFTWQCLHQPWLDPGCVSIRRLPMRSACMRWFTSEHSARQAACQPNALPALNLMTTRGDVTTTSSTSTTTTITTPNVYNLDQASWQFSLHRSPHEALKVPLRLCRQQQQRNTCNDDDENTNTNWISMPVPSHWTLHPAVPDHPIYTNQQYPWPCQPPMVPTDPNPTGVYQLDFDWPWPYHDNDNSNSNNRASSVSSDNVMGGTAAYSLLLHGIESCCFVYWNGHFVGMTKDSRLEAEFDVTPYVVLQNANNNIIKKKKIQIQLHLIVARWSDGSYVEDQDHWWMAGVWRSVELIQRRAATAPASLEDVRIVQARPAPSAMGGRKDDTNQGGGGDFATLQVAVDYAPQFVLKTALSSQVQHYIQLCLYNDHQLSPEGGCRLGDCLWSHTEEILALQATIDSTDDDDHGDDSNVVPVTTTKSSPPPPLVTLFVQGLIPGDIVQAWTAETPHLYTLTATLLSRTTTTTTTSSTMSKSMPPTTTGETHTTVTHQAESCRVGFRVVDISRSSTMTMGDPSPVVRINGRPLTVCGMNRHEHDPDHGKAISWRTMQQDIVLLKQNNFNLVRTSHYPNHPTFYRLCDYYGLYVWDEANLETHGLKPMGRLAHDWGWHDAFTSRTARLVQRDLNHASVIFWSLGNEAGRGRNFRSARHSIQTMDRTRPVLYEGGGAIPEGTGRTELTDVICTMYPSVPRMLLLATRTDEDRPVILCEYSHAMGNSNGNLHLYWQAFWDPAYPRLQGGCIWDMIDQGLRKSVPQGQNTKSNNSYFGYGGDFGDTVNDLNFCINGMFSPDRDPHPAVAEIKYLQQPVSISVADQQSIVDGVVHMKVPPSNLTLRIQNRYSFRDLSHLAWSWQLHNGRSPDPIHSGSFELGRTKSQAQVVLSLEPAISRVRLLERIRSDHGSSAVYYLNVRAYLHDDAPWAGAGHVVASEQFQVQFDFTEYSTMGNTGNSTPPLATLARTRSAATATAKIEAVNDGKTVKLFQVPADTSKHEILVIDRATAAIVSYTPTPGGENVLTHPLTPNFTRVETDNDRGGMELALGFMFPFPLSIGVSGLYQILFGHQEFSYATRWRKAGLDQSCPPNIHCYLMTTEPGLAEEGSIAVTGVCKVVSAKSQSLIFKLVIQYTVFCDGRVCIRQHVDPQRRLHFVSSLPRIGVSFGLQPALYRVQYHGRGPGENYPDRKSGSELGVYDTTPAEMGYLKYVYPTENGSRSDCRWISFRAESGAGLCLVSREDVLKSTPHFNVSALLYSASELHAATHTCDLESRKAGRDKIYVNIDHKMMGVGGDVSWYPVVYPEFQVKPENDYSYQVWLIPLSKGDDASTAAATALRLD